MRQTLESGVCRAICRTRASASFRAGGAPGMSPVALEGKPLPAWLAGQPRTRPVTMRASSQAARASGVGVQGGKGKLVRRHEDGGGTHAVSTPCSSATHCVKFPQTAAAVPRRPWPRLRRGPPGEAHAHFARRGEAHRSATVPPLCPRPQGAARRPAARRAAPTSARTEHWPRSLTGGGCMGVDAEGGSLGEDAGLRRVLGLQEHIGALLRLPGPRGALVVDAGSPTRADLVRSVVMPSVSSADLVHRSGAPSIVSVASGSVAGSSVCLHRAAAGLAGSRPWRRGAFAGT